MSDAIEQGEEQEPIESPDNTEPDASDYWWYQGDEQESGMDSVKNGLCVYCGGLTGTNEPPLPGFGHLCECDRDSAADDDYWWRQGDEWEGDDKGFDEGAKDCWWYDGVTRLPTDFGSRPYHA